MLHAPVTTKGLQAGKLQLSAPSSHAGHSFAQTMSPIGEIYKFTVELLMYIFVSEFLNFQNHPGQLTLLVFEQGK